MRKHQAFLQAQLMHRILIYRINLSRSCFRGFNICNRPWRILIDYLQILKVSQKLKKIKDLYKFSKVQLQEPNNNLRLSKRYNSKRNNLLKPKEGVNLPSPLKIRRLTKTFKQFKPFKVLLQFREKENEIIKLRCQ